MRSEPLLGLKQIIDASGTITAIGAVAANQEPIGAAAAILTRAVEIPEVHRTASLAIVQVTGAEAGCVTACASAGISVAVAATMTGDGLTGIARLPHSGGLRNDFTNKDSAIDFVDLATVFAP